MTTTFGPENPAFVGFIPPSERPSSTVSYYSCPNQYHFTSSASFNGCCAPDDTSCQIATTCVDGTLSFASGTAVTCSGSNKCQTQLLIPATPSPVPTLTAHICGADLPFGKTLYRADPAAKTASSSTASQTSSSATPISTTVPPSITAPPIYTPTTPSRHSKAWIAGAVAGPAVFVFALLSLVGYLVLRRRRQRRAQRRSTVLSTKHPGSSHSKRDRASFYYNTDMARDHRESTGPWSPYAEDFGSSGALARHMSALYTQSSTPELSGDESTQIPAELPGGRSTHAIELPARSVHRDRRRHRGKV